MGKTKRTEATEQVKETIQADKLLPVIESLVDNALKTVDEFPALKLTITANTDIDNIIMYRTLIKCPFCGYSMFWEWYGWGCWRCGNFVLHTWMGC